MRITRSTLALVLGTAAGTGALVAAVVVLAVGGDNSSAAAAAPQPVTRAPVATGLTPETIYQRDAPGVVVITATETQKVAATLFSPAQTERVGVLGSGFVVNAKGDIVTNDHVVQGGKMIRVGFSNGASYPATIVGTDVSSDIAVVHVQAPAAALHPLAFGDSEAVRVGDPVYAIGNPLGLDRTMTSGITSAIGRDIKAPNGRTIPSAIQTDAAINHGNSGGPLINRYGRIVGINDQIASASATGGSIGLGFAISSDTARSIADQLIATGHVEQAWLGVEVATIDPSVAKVVSDLPAHGVVVVSATKGSPAAKAGLEGATRQVTVKGMSALLGGDAIVKVDGTPIDSAEQFANVIALRKPGERVTLEVVRAGKSRTVSITLQNTPAQT
jgi:S1-C subfamily serine protease